MFDSLVKLLILFNIVLFKWSTSVFDTLSILEFSNLKTKPIEE